MQSLKTVENQFFNSQQDPLQQKANPDTLFWLTFAVKQAHFSQQIPAFAPYIFPAMSTETAQEVAATN